MLLTLDSQASPFATKLIATTSYIHLWDMHFNQQTPLKKLQQHSCSSLIGLAGVRTGTWRINDYPEHTCVLAKFSAASMLLNPTEVWLDAPPQPQHNKNNKMQLIVVWNNQGKQALNESNPASWLNNLKQTIPEATWICNNTAHVLGNARVNARTSRKRNFNSYTQKLPFLLTSASGKCLITQTSTSTRAHTFQKYTTKNQSLKLTVVPYKTRPVTNK